MARVLLLGPCAVFREPSAFLLKREAGIAVEARATSPAEVGALIADGVSLTAALVDLSPGASPPAL